MPHEGLNLANLESRKLGVFSWKLGVFSRKLGVFSRKLEGSHFLSVVIFAVILINIRENEE